MNKIYLLIVFFIFISFTICKAQSDSAYTPQYAKDVKYVLISKLGVKYIGYVDAETETTITFINQKTKVRIYFYKNEIKSITPYNRNSSNTNTKLPETYEENEHADTYMIASSCLLFKPGKIISTYHWGIVDNLTFPISENWAITANTIFIYPYSIGVKNAFKLAENSYIGGTGFGMINISSKGSNDLVLGYCAKANFTQGTSNNNFTISGGVLGLNATIFTNNTSAGTPPFLNLYFANFAYCNRFSNRFSLNAEGWYFPETLTGFVGAGIKTVANSYTSWTFGCYTAVNNFNGAFKINSKALILPYVGYSQNF